MIATSAMPKQSGIRPGHLDAVQCSAVIVRLPCRSKARPINCRSPKRTQLCRRQTPLRPFPGPRQPPIWRSLVLLPAIAKRTSHPVWLRLSKTKIMSVLLRRRQALAATTSYSFLLSSYIRLDSLLSSTPYAISLSLYLARGRTTTSHRNSDFLGLIAAWRFI